MASETHKPWLPQEAHEQPTDLHAAFVGRTRNLNVARLTGELPLAVQRFSKEIGDGFWTESREPQRLQSPGSKRKPIQGSVFYFWLPVA